MSDLVSFTVETASGTLDIEYLEDSGLAYTDRYTWFSLADGEYTALDNELTEDLVSLVTGLSWGECVDYDADVKDLGDYGLDTPSVTVSVSYIETTEVETNETDEDGEPVYDPMPQSSLSQNEEPVDGVDSDYLVGQPPIGYQIYEVPDTMQTYDLDTAQADQLEALRGELYQNLAGRLLAALVKLPAEDAALLADNMSEEDYAAFLELAQP